MRADGVSASTAEGDPNVGTVGKRTFLVCFEATAAPVAALAWWTLPVVLLDRRPARDPRGSQAIHRQRDALDVWTRSVRGRTVAAEGVTGTTARTSALDRGTWPRFARSGNRASPRCCASPQCSPERPDPRLQAGMGVLPARAGGVILGICERGKGHAVSLVERPEPDGEGSGSGQVRVRDLLRQCGATRERHERAAAMARLADELTHAADDIAADPDRARQYREVVAGLRGQADMARVAAAFDGHPFHVERGRAC